MKIESAAFEMSAGLCSQLPQATLPEAAFSGRSNVGKSSLINRLLRRKSLARTSATPGKTITVNFYRLDTLRLVDLPGYGYARVAGAERRRFSELVGGYFDADRDLRLVVQLVDLRHPATADDLQMIDFLEQRGIPFVIAATKADKLNKTERARRAAALHAQLAAHTAAECICFSAVTGEGAEVLLERIRAAAEG